MFTALRSAPGGVSVDYIRGNLVDRARLRPAARRPGADNDLAEFLDHYVSRAIGEPAARCACSVSGEARSRTARTRCSASGLATGCTTCT